MSTSHENVSKEKNGWCMKKEKKEEVSRGNFGI